MLVEWIVKCSFAFAFFMKTYFHIFCCSQSFTYKGKVFLMFDPKKGNMLEKVT